MTVAELFAGTHDVIRCVGRDRLSENHLARDRARDCAVLIKILAPADDNTYRRFLRNAPLLERINHPGLQPLVASGRKDDVCWFIVDFVEGESLWKRMKREPGRAIGAPLALDIAGQLCDALGAAHDAAVVHGDLNPDRILVHEGRAVITDLGFLRVFLPKADDDDDDSVILGNPAWLAPEQLENTRLDATTDVHGVGGLLYFMLTGETPFTGGTPIDVIRAIITGPRPRYKANPAIDAVIQRAMAIDPAARYQAMRDLAGALRSVAQR